MLRVPVKGSAQYTINEFGEVYENGSNEPLEQTWTREGRPRVYLHIDTTYKMSYRQVDRLMLNSFVPGVSDTEFFSVRHLDGNLCNNHLDNLIWDTTGYIPLVNPGVSDPVDMFSPIPGIPGYEINSFGVVRNKETLVELKNTTALDASGNNRVSVVLTLDGIAKRYYIHRLLAMAFFKHPWDCEHLVVNHIDGRPDNNTLLNLEWTTSARNNQHAFEEGLRTAKDVLLKSVETGEERSFATLQRAAEFLDVKRNYLHTYLAAKLVRKFTPCKGWMVKYADDPTPWGSVDTGATGVLIGLDLTKKQVTVFTTRKEASRYTGIGESTIAVLSGEKSPRPWAGWMFQVCSGDPKDAVWPIYPEESVQLFEQMTRKCSPVRVTDLTTGKTTAYLGVKYWWKEYRPTSDCAIVSRHLKWSDTWNNWKFTYFDLYETCTQLKTYPLAQQHN